MLKDSQILQDQGNNDLVKSLMNKILHELLILTTNFKL